MFVAHYSLSAENDVTETLEYISYSLNASIASRNLFYEIGKKIESIENNPYSCPLVRDDYLASKGIRWAGVKNYMMFYIVDDKDEKINLVRFLYGRRDWIRILKDEINKDEK
jgi:plasmid stabilization system protein ParE